MSELESLQTQLKDAQDNLLRNQKEIKRLENAIRILKLRISSKGYYGKNCKNWMKDCWTFQNCIYADICLGNQLRRGP